MFFVAIGGVLVLLGGVTAWMDGAKAEPTPESLEILRLDDEIEAVRYRLRAGELHRDELGRRLTARTAELEVKRATSVSLAMERDELAESVDGAEEELADMRADASVMREVAAGARARQQEIASLQRELEELDRHMNEERERFRSSLRVINTLTDNKTRAVVEGSPAYYDCLNASRAMDAITRRAPVLKKRREDLEARLLKARRRQ
jgi:chromosome segregation ATPase